MSGFHSVRYKDSNRLRQFSSSSIWGITYLDQITSITPRMALSLRKLVSTATVAIRVRRSSDSAEQDIGFVGNVLDTVSLATFVGGNSAFVTKMYDQTGHGFDAVQATAANQPRIVNAGTYDGKVVFNGTTHSLKVTALTQGAPQVGIYSKVGLSPSSGVRIFAEQSINYNNNPQSFVLYTDTSTAGVYNVSVRNTIGASDFRLKFFTATTSSLLHLTTLMDRSIVGTNETSAWQSGVSLSGANSGSPAEQTGNFTAYDLYLGARAGTSLFSDMSIETFVLYNGDTAADRVSIEAITG